MLRVRLLMALLATVATSVHVACVSIRVTDFLNERPIIVRPLARNGLLPCTCDAGVFNCTERGLPRLQDGDRCAEATTVDLSRNLLSRFPDGLNSATKVIAFQNWLTAMPTINQLNPAIAYLDISQNIIDNATSYQTLSSLEELYLHQTKLGSLWFLPNPCALKKLHASVINLRNLEDSVLVCHHLEELYVEENQISSLAPGIFSTLTHLRKLMLRKNPLRTLSPQLFANLTQLQILSLKSTQISELPPHIFDSLTQLKELRLSGNSIQTFPPGIFSSLTRLSILDLAANNIENLPLEAFQHLQALEELSLHYNKLKTIPDGAFLPLVNLKELHLLNNELKSIGTNLLSNTTQLEVISLDGNPLQSFPRDILNHGTSLKYALVPCVRNSGDLSHLSHLTMVTNNECGEVHWNSRAYAALTNVKLLGINNNQVISVANDTFDGLNSIQVLDISHNYISELPAAIFSYTPTLKMIALYRNNLTTVPENIFSGLIHIRDILLGHNHLSQIPENVFQGLVSLERVDLSDNQLSSIPPGLFRNLPALYEISFEANKLTTLPSLDLSWPYLRKVSLQDNEIREISRAALLSWLGTGDADRYVLLSEEEGHGARPQELEWLSREPGVAIRRATTRDCRCWLVRRGSALLFLCLDAVCPPAADGAEGTADPSWEDMLRANTPTAAAAATAA